MGTGDRASRTILLVDDDASLLTMLSEGLRMRGYTVWSVGSANDAEQAINAVAPDVVVLDLMLPDRNGLTLCAQLKRRVGTSVIICSATRRKDDAVIGLQLGADDFLRKPFSLEELEARIGLALRRAPLALASQPPHATPPSLGTLIVDTAQCEATVDGRPLPLTPTEFRLLSVLSSRTPEVVSRHELAEGVWGSIDEDVIRSLDVHMRRLRAKLTAAAPSLRLATRRGFGYQLVDGGAPAAAAPR